MPAPKIWAKAISRMSPVIRDSTVIPLTMTVDLSIFFDIEVNRGGDPMLGPRLEKPK